MADYYSGGKPPPIGASSRCYVAGLPVLVFNVAGHLYSTAQCCPQHLGAPLDTTPVGADLLATCPQGKERYRVDNGQPQGGALPVAAFRVAAVAGAQLKFTTE